MSRQEDSSVYSLFDVIVQVCPFILKIALLGPRGEYETWTLLEVLDDELFGGHWEGSKSGKHNQTRVSLRHVDNFDYQHYQTRVSLRRGRERTLSEEREGSVTEADNSTSNIHPAFGRIEIISFTDCNNNSREQ